MRRSITSTEVPSAASVSATASDSCTVEAYVMIEMSVPARATRALPIGTIRPSGPVATSAFSRR